MSTRYTHRVDAKTKQFIDALKTHVGDRLAAYAKELQLEGATVGTCPLDTVALAAASDRIEPSELPTTRSLSSRFKPDEAVILPIPVNVIAREEDVVCGTYYFDALSPAASSRRPSRNDCK
ncbi:hypothetical protein [Paraburkholderia sp. BL18I3N2]|uniref:hypothetical protein n=1 Tax=Paraburkholderia sp. BL18I3N2 TaxID=1938799 RepID=UPI0021592FBC|nr:hypothetical protein [Paraburkholderia sp. BL18I3N2]